MDKLKSLLREVVDRTRSTEAALDREYSGLGEALLKETLGTGASAELQELFGKAQETRERIKNSQANTERLVKLLSQQSETRSAIEEKEGELAILEEEIEPHYEKVGRATVEAEIDDEPDTMPVRRSVEQLRTLEADIRQINRELNRGGMVEEGRGVITQALSGGKKLYLQGLLRTKELRSTALYRKLGQEMCSADLVAHLETAAPGDIFEPVLKYREQKKRIDAQRSTLTNKAERVQSEIASLCGNERPQRYLQRREHERDEAHEELDRQLRDLGSQFAERAVGSTSMAKEVRSRLNAVKTVRGELRSLVERRERVEAAIGVEELERKVDANRTKVRTLENTVKKANQEIEGLSAEIKGLNEEREKLIKLRGSLDELRLGSTEEE